MKRLLSLIIILTLSTLYAQDNTDPFIGLSASEKAQVLAQVEDMRRGPVDVEKYSQYLELGRAAGVAITEAAKGTGIAVNDFVDTKAGMITVALIGWHVAGKDLMTLQKQIFRYFVGFFILFLFFPSWIYFFKRMCVISSIEWTEDGKRKKSIIYRDPKDQDASMHGTRVIMGIVLVVVLLLIWACMFG